MDPLALDFAAFVDRRDAAAVFTVDRQLLLIEARDETGGLVDGVRLVPKGFELPRLAAESAACRAPDATGWELPEDGDGRCLLLTPLGYGWVIGAGGEHVVPTVLRHEAIATGAVGRQMVLRAESRFGSLQVAVRTAAGDPVPYLQVEVRMPERAYRCEAGGATEDGRVVFAELPAGRARIGIRCREPVPTPLGILMTTFDEEREIAAGGRCELAFAVPPHGRVALRLRDPEQRARVFDAVRVRCDDLPGERPGTWCTGAAAPQEPLLLLADPVPVGRRVLGVEVRGYWPTSCAVDVVDGGFAIVDVDLVAR